MTKVIPISEARAKLPQLVDQASTLARTTYITVKGKVKAAIVDARELELMEETLEVLSNPETMKAIEQGKKDIKAGRLISLEDVKNELGLK
jgi:prevent-host-death family protein